MKSILSLIEGSCQKFPERIAAADDQTNLTYQQLSVVTKQVGSHLLSLSLRNKPMAVYLDKTPSCVASMLGILYSGNFYVVLDTAMPAERIKRIFETLNPAAVITDENHKEAAAQFCESIPVFLYENCLKETIREEDLAAIRKSMIDTDPAYALYTSGSTGRPKGAIVSHKALIAYTSWFIKEFSINEESIFGSQTPLYFSMSVSDLYGALRTGATYQIIPKKYFSFPMQLMEYLNQYKVNTIYWVPFALCIVANWDTFSYCKPDYLKKVLFAGESMPNKQLNYWRKMLPDLLYANLFGPTETTDICCFYIVDREFKDEESLPIGYACDNCGLLIVDEDGKESNQGELMVKGPFLANGYYNDPEKTAAAFIQNPTQSSYPEIVYKTGDLVKREESGELTYLGRKDFQIKHMGYRIELGEIEANIGSMDKIQSCVCVYDAALDKIVLIYQGKVKVDKIVEQVSNRLPNYMRPNEYIRVKQMPQNANGKIDRSYLKNNYKNL